MRKWDNKNSTKLPAEEVVTIDVIEEKVARLKAVVAKAEEILSHMREMERQTQLH
jgi:hypothetical protein